MAADDTDAYADEFSDKHANRYTDAVAYSDAVHMSSRAAVGKSISNWLHVPGSDVGAQQRPM